MMAIALGMDAFSLAIGLGLNGLTRKDALELCGWIGVFHVAMTIAGLTIGALVQGVIGHWAQWFGAVLLIALGLHMLYATLFVKQSLTAIGATLPAMMLFSATVSVDAMSVGFSLGLRSATYGIVSAITFGFVGAAMCLIGVGIGKRAGGLTGLYGELFGAVILIGYGIHLLSA